MLQARPLWQRFGVSQAPLRQRVLIGWGADTISKRLRISHLDGRMVGRLLTSKGITRDCNGASPLFSGDELSDSQRDEPLQLRRLLLVAGSVLNGG